MCQKVSTTLNFGKTEMEIFVGFEKLSTECSISSCSGDLVKTISPKVKGQRNIIFQQMLDKRFYGKGANLSVVEIDDSCSDICEEVFFIPKIEQTG